MEIKDKSNFPIAPIDINELREKIEKIIDQKTYVHYRHQEYIVNGSNDAASEIVKILPTSIVINEEFIEWLNLEYTMDKETKKYYPNYMYGYDEQQITVQEAYAEFFKKVKK